MKVNGKVSVDFGSDRKDVYSSPELLGNTWMGPVFF